MPKGPRRDGAVSERRHGGVAIRGDDVEPGSVVSMDEPGGRQGLGGKLPSAD